MSFLEEFFFSSQSKPNLDTFFGDSYIFETHSKGFSSRQFALSTKWKTKTISILYWFVFVSLNPKNKNKPIKNGKHHKRK